jgi:hypothetical protein
MRLGDERRRPLAELPAMAYESIRPGPNSGVYQLMGVAKRRASKVLPSAV